MSSLKPASPQADQPTGRGEARVPFSDTKMLSETTELANRAGLDIAINIRNVSYWRSRASHLRPRRSRNEVLHQLLEFGSMFLNLSSFVKGEIAGLQLERALDDVSVQIPRGSIVCVVDIGGLSRIPLMRIVARMTPPKSGEVILKGRVVSLEQADAIPMPFRTMRHNLLSLGSLLGLQRNEVLSAFPAMEAFTGRPEFFDMPGSTVPKSKKSDIALSLVCSGPFDIIVVEEVRKIASEAWLQFLDEAPARGKTLLISSSKLQDALDLSTHALLLDKGRVLDFGTIPEALTRHPEFIETALRAPLVSDESVDDEQYDEM